jgi:hypothetical protein
MSCPIEFFKQAPAALFKNATLCLQLFFPCDKMMELLPIGEYYG